MKRILNFFLLLTIAHLLGDFPFQTNWVYRQKFRSLLGGLWHTAILTLCYLAVLSSHLANWRVVLAIICLATIHYLQDLLKTELVNKRKIVKKIHGFWLDQAAHFILIVGISFWLDSLKLGGWRLEETTLRFAAIYLIVILSSTFVWNVICHVRQAEEKPKKMFQHNWKEVLIRGGIVTIAFALIYLITAS